MPKGFETAVPTQAAQSRRLNPHPRRTANPVAGRWVNPSRWSGGSTHKRSRTVPFPRLPQVLVVPQTHTGHIRLLKGRPMGLAAELKSLRETKPRTFEQWLEVADAEDKALVEEAIGDRTLLPNALSIVLRRNGVPVSRETIIALRENGQRDAQG